MELFSALDHVFLRFDMISNLGLGTDNTAKKLNMRGHTTGHTVIFEVLRRIQCKMLTIPHS